MPKIPLTTADVARLLKVTPGRIRQHVANGELRAHRVGTMLFFAPKDVTSFQRKPRGARGPQKKFLEKGR